MTDDASTPQLGGKYHFLLRRLHSLSGIVPVGMFVIFHLFTNFQMVFEGAFQHEVNFIHSMPALIFLEVGIWAGIGFHAVLGILYTVHGAKPNATQYGYWGNWRYSLQRISGIVALIFILLHIATLRWRWDVFGWFDPFYVSGLAPDGNEIPLAHASTAAALQAGWLVVLVYAIGALAVVYHWANGLWTAAITWGLTISDRAQSRWAYVCAGLFIALTVFFSGAIVGAVGYDVNDHERFAIEYAKATGQGATPKHHGEGEPVALDAEVVERVKQTIAAKFSAEER